MRGRVALGVLGLWGCTDLDPLQSQPRADAYAQSTFFADGRVLRTPPAGTLPQEWYAQTRGLTDGGDPDAGFAQTLPLPLTRALLEEGRDHFETWCATCHGRVGEGRSRVAEKMGLRRPPALVWPHSHAHQMARGALEVPDGGRAQEGEPGRLSHPPGYYYAVITEGFGLMPSYADALTPRERWAVVAWLRVLAVSQAAPLSAAPPEVRVRLEAQRP